MTVPYFYKNSNSRFLSIEGEDSNEFLQNLITNDINKCSEDNIIYSCLLSPQGKFLSDFFIFKKDEKYLIAPEDRIVSPIKFEQINKIFTGISLQFYNLYIYLIV